jgi:hypothetical protein
MELIITDLVEQRSRKYTCLGGLNVPSTSKRHNFFNGLSENAADTMIVDTEVVQSQ